MPAQLTDSEKAQLEQTIEMFEVITQSQPQDYQSLEILKEAYFKLGRETDVVGTSKRIAQAYVQLGQLSSAILEYESILQRFPDDPDVQAALADIENRATNFAAPPPVQMPEPEMPKAKPASGPGRSDKPAAPDIDDGRQLMQKYFVEAKLISAGDFDMYWNTPGLTDPGRVVEPFVQILADKGLVPVEQSLKLLSERSRLAYLPLEKYDIDIELARSFPREVCQRWCVLPIDRMSKSVFVATTNPFNKYALQELQQRTPHRLLYYLSPPADLIKFMGKIFRR